MDNKPSSLCLTNGVMTGTTSIVGDTIKTGNCCRWSFQAEWTGNPTGTLVVQGSLQIGVGSIPVPTWTNIPFTLTPGNPAGTASSAIIDVLTACEYIRVQYTNTTGTGTLNVRSSAKSS